MNNNCKLKICNEIDLTLWLSKKIFCKMKTTLKRFLNSLYKNCKDLYKIEYRNKLSMPYYLHQVLIGLLLSDGFLEKSSPISTVRLSITFGILHVGYLFHLFVLFEPYTDSGVQIIKVNNKKINTKYLEVKFNTVSLPIFLIYHKLFYIKDSKSKRFVKIVPLNIEYLMTPVVLAHLIMGDGNFKSPDNIIRIYTNSFSKSDVERLGLAISNKLGIMTKVVHDRNDQYILTISKNQLEIVRSLILPYMHNSMIYKLGLNAEDTKNLSFEYNKYLDIM